MDSLYGEGNLKMSSIKGKILDLVCMHHIGMQMDPGCWRSHLNLRMGQ